MPAPASGPDPTTTPDPAHLILHGVTSGLWQAVTTTWWFGPALGLVLVMSVVRAVRALLYPRGRTDPVRCFSRSDKMAILARAGYRCEHHGMFGRCRQTQNLEADHVHPHSRGGQTALANGQALCRTHNRAKRANVPFNRTLRTIERRRAAYFPESADPGITRFRG